MLRLTGATVCGLAFCFGWPIFITHAFVGLIGLLLLRSGHEWGEAFYRAHGLEVIILHRIGVGWQIVLIFAMLIIAALGGGAVAGHLANGRAYPGAALVCALSGFYLVYYYVDEGGSEHLLFALCLLAGAACVFLGCFAARFLRTRIRWP